MRGLRYRMEDWALSGLAWLARVLPPPMRDRLGAGLGRLMGVVLPSLSRMSRENIAAAYPEWDAARVAALSRANFAHIGRMALEFFSSPAMSPGEIERAVRVEGLETLQEALAEGRGVFMLGGHIGNWELGGYRTALLGLKVSLIWRRMKNPHVERRVSDIRRRFGAGLIPHRQAVRPVMKALKEGGLIAFLLDQRGRGKEYVPSRFFGRPVATNHGLALLALRTGAPVVYGECVREGEGYVLRFGPRVTPPDAENRDDAVAEFTRRFDRVLEQAVRRHPEQWFWLHKRWRLPDDFAKRSDAGTPEKVAGP